MEKRIVITGFGGQGVIMAGRVLGQAAAIGDGRESTLIQSYGPESRGGACSAQVTISDEAIHFPYIKFPDILVCMSQAGYDKHRDILTEDGALIYDLDLVKPPPGREHCFGVPSTRYAEEMGLKMMANIIMLGFLTAITKVVSIEAAKDAVAQSVPKHTQDLNLDAFSRGVDCAKAALKAISRKARGRTGAMP
ncbi:MAG: pyruvate ferredoxin oxidoreductase [Desulfobacterales bacterium]|nr:pyruvate ferredoxin oxidoreductase [Desulfobacterales bacterium]